MWGEEEKKGRVRCVVGGFDESNDVVESSRVDRLPSFALSTLSSSDPVASAPRCPRHRGRPRCPCLACPSLLFKFSQRSGSGRRKATA